MSFPLPPSARLGRLFAAVQEARLFADSKTFADATPRRADAAILAEWQAAQPAGEEELRRFVAANFDLPALAPAAERDHLPLPQHIAGLWPLLIRRSSGGGLSEMPLPYPYVVPGGRFRELYYWDSWFTMLGLARSGRHDLIDAMIADFGSLLERFGHIPNGSRSYYLSRSHPPFFYLMTRLASDRSPRARRQRLEWMRIERRFWMEGGEELGPGETHRRVVRLPDGALLNRYWDDLPAPRDESWAEDVALAAASTRHSGSVWRDLRAACESGWDFSSRWLPGGASLATIRTTRRVPIDLNCLLFGLEQEIARESTELGDTVMGACFATLAARRRETIERHLWHAQGGHHTDLDLDTGRPTGQLTGAAAFPLFTGLSSPDRAAHIAMALRRLLRAGGLLATLAYSGQQWDAPNGWAPLQWVAVAGLRHYGETALADEIAGRWLAMVEAQYRATGQLYEKYDVESLRAGGGGEYAGVTGFGWTNGVVLEMLATAKEEGLR